MNADRWLTWSDGKPVQVGDIAMSYHGPKRVDGIEYDKNGWRLWTYFSRSFGKLCRRYIIDEGHFGVDDYGLTAYPVRADSSTAVDEFDNQWLYGDEIVPNHVFIGVPSWLADVLDGIDSIDMAPEELVQAIVKYTDRPDWED